MYYCSKCNSHFAITKDDKECPDNNFPGKGFEYLVCPSCGNEAIEDNILKCKCGAWCKTSNEVFCDDCKESIDDSIDTVIEELIRKHCDSEDCKDDLIDRINERIDYFYHEKISMFIATPDDSNFMTCRCGNEEEIYGEPELTACPSCGCVGRWG